MKKLFCAIALTVAISSAAVAQVTAKTWSLEPFVGWSAGDADYAESSWDFGARLWYDWSETWGLNASLAFRQGDVNNLVWQDASYNMTLLDLNVHYYLMQHEKFPWFFTAGLGWGWASNDPFFLEDPVTHDFEDIWPVSPDAFLADGDGFITAADLVEINSGLTFNVGFGFNWYFRDRVSLQVEGRYHFLNFGLENMDGTYDADAEGGLFDINIGIKFHLN